MANKVIVTLDLKDLATAGVKKFNQAVDHLNKKIRESGDTGKNSYRGLTGAIGDSILKANLLTSAFEAAAQGAFALGGAIKDAFSEAAQVQLDTVGLVADLASITKESYNSAFADFQQVSREVERAGNAFPVADTRISAVMRGFGDDIYKANLEMGKGIDQIVKDSANLIPRIALMAEKTGFSAELASRFSSQFLGGRLTLNQVRALDFFSGNKMFMDTVESYLEKTGEDLKDLSSQQLYQLYQAAVNAQVTEEYVKQASKTVKGIWNSFTGTLFGENFGLLSLSRDLDSKSQGTQSAIDAFAKVLDALIGEKGLVTTIGGILSDLGLSGDPMQALRGNLLWFRDTINRFNLFLQDVRKNGFNVPSMEQINGFVESLPRNIGSFLERITQQFANTDLNGLEDPTTGILNSLLRGLSKIDYTAIFSNIGKGIANLVNTGADIVAGLDLGAIVSTAGGIAIGVLKGIATAVTNLDAKTYAVAAVGLISSSIVLPFLGNLALAIAGISFAGPVGILVIAAGLAMGAFAKTLIEHWDEITALVVPGLKNLYGIISDSLGLIVAIITADGEGVQRRVTSLMSRVSSLFEGIFNNIIFGLNMLGANIPTLGESRSRGAQAEAERRYQETVKANGTTVAGYVPSRADGFTSGLIQAAVREGQRMPSGAGIVVANTTEQILNRQQQNALGRTLASRGNSIVVKIGNIISQASDPSEVANQVIARIERDFQQASRMRVSPLGA